jgi:hypothetical protein
MKKFNSNLDVIDELGEKCKKSGGRIFPNPFSGFNKKVRQRIYEQTEETNEANALKFKQPTFPQKENKYVQEIYDHDNDEKEATRYKRDEKAVVKPELDEDIDTEEDEPNN